MRARHRAAYARTQRLITTSRKRYVSNVLSGTWEEEPSPVPMALQELYWRGVFQQPSIQDLRRPPPKGRTQWSLVAPITVGDITRAIKGMSDLWAMSREEVAAHFDVWLLAGYLPASLRRAETVLIAKEAGVPSAEKHHPITISDIILQCFHKILSSRFESSLPWNTCQKAFMKGDGVADSIWLLQSIIRQHQRLVSKSLAHTVFFKN